MKLFYSYDGTQGERERESVRARTSPGLEPDYFQFVSHTPYRSFLSFPLLFPPSSLSEFFETNYVFPSNLSFSWNFCKILVKKKEKDFFQFSIFWETVIPTEYDESKCRIKFRSRKILKKRNRTESSTNAANLKPEPFNTDNFPARGYCLAIWSFPPLFFSASLSNRVAKQK